MSCPFLQATARHGHPVTDWDVGGRAFPPAAGRVNKRFSRAGDLPGRPLDPEILLQFACKPLIFGRPLLQRFTVKPLKIGLFVWSAKPCTPVQFRAWPPIKSIAYGHSDSAQLFPAVFRQCRWRHSLTARTDSQRLSEPRKLTVQVMLRVPPPPPRSGFIAPCLPSPAHRPPQAHYGI
jgi:hypothetical protein